MAKRPRPRRMSASEQRAAEEKRRGLIKLGIALAVVASVATIYFSVASSRRPLDEVTLCPSEPQSITVLLVDVTDPMNVAQRQDFRNQLTRLRNSIPRFGQLIVAKVDTASDELIAPVIIRCNPGTAADEDDTTGDPQALQERYDTGFVAPLDQAFAEISQASGAEQSPILESVQSLALTELLTPSATELPRRLVLVSDLLQNTTSISFYDGLPNGEEFVESPEFRRVRTDLRNIEVELWM